ncbi:phosphoribosyltransferase family protein [Oceanimonas sp. CHS3-5]|uniref:ComF family protein n=1 Tax=Oceanimonas sp. CHS3-5 TaxID=3068186 RepID=UPI00273DEF1F|nr:phosphoribosyltransferase family protein [Oceanimonas sp. CHS3-5]MDP5293270.1 phosphoribosyltransferase family protein [Oceanimonas sp. CHS3-5]
MIRPLLTRLQSGPLWWGQCLLCRQDCQDTALLCRHCRTELPVLEHPCPGCAFPLPLDDAHCGRCQKRPPPWQRMRVLAPFEAPFSRLVHDLKYHGRLLNGRLLGRLLAEQLAPPWPEAVLPVPLYWWRRLRRGYNQADEIARELGRELNIQVDHHLLRRVRATPSQTHLSKMERRRNLRGAFTAVSCPYRHVALLDDVITTGATMAELTRLLHAQGVERVEVWAVCRTLEH